MVLEEEKAVWVSSL